MTANHRHKAILMEMRIRFETDSGEPCQCAVPLTAYATKQIRKISKRIGRILDAEFRA